MGTTDDPNDPRLSHGVDEPGSKPGMADAYLVLSEEERAAGFVRPVRRLYMHLTCGTLTMMGVAIAETFARRPDFYGATYCCKCQNHRPVGENGEFVWDGTNIKVGT
jgi:hypothetical protein